MSSRIPDAGAFARGDIVPPPWQLAGYGYVVVLNTRDDRGARFLPPTLAAQRITGPGVLMFVDYSTSGVGAYRELLFIPGRVPSGKRAAWTIGRIFVSTQASVASGRANWGIPKDLAEFEVTPSGEGHRVRVMQHGSLVADLSFSVWGPRLPMPGWLMPARFRRFVQHHDDRTFAYSPRASGRTRLARLDTAVVDTDAFPDIRPSRVHAAAQVPQFLMSFPVAEIRPG